MRANTVMAVFGEEENKTAKDYAEDFGTFRKTGCSDAGSDEVAAGMVMEALKNVVKIPQDIAIMGVDDQPFGILSPDSVNNDMAACTG